MNGAAAAIVSSSPLPNDGDEIIWHVPNEIAQMPLGFVIDAGGSVTKLIYRSKKDYECGQLKHNDEEPSQGIFRLRYFRLGESEDLIEFLKQNCDVMVNKEKDSQKIWLHTGFNTQFFGKQLGQTFGIRIKMQSEVTALMKCIADIFIHNRTPELKQFLPPSLPALEKTLRVGRCALAGVQQLKAAGDDTFHNIVSNSFLFDYCNTIMTTDAQAWAQTLRNQDLTFPCMIVCFGSANSSFIMFEDGKYIPSSFDAVGGKTFLALGLTLTGAKNYEEFIEMAERGDNNKVDALFKDLKTGDNEGNWYDALPDEMIAFALGKMTNGNKFAGNFTNDDLAAAILQMICSISINATILNARCHKIQSVIFTGSFVNSSIARETLEHTFRLACLQQVFYGLGDFSIFPDAYFNKHQIIRCQDHRINPHFLPNPGFLVALGVWLENLEMRT